MKKLTKIFTLFLLFCGMIIAFGCGEEETPEVKIESIEIVSESIPTSILTTELNDLYDIKITVKKTDGNVETINLNASMISVEDMAKLVNEGSHKIKVSYEGFETELTINVKKPTEPEPEKDPLEYSVLIKDIAGKPLANFYVLFYLGNDVVDEGYTDNSGIFKTELLPNKYDVIIEEREGYYLNETAFETDLLGTQIVVECELDSLEDVYGDEFTSYTTGDIMYDFVLTDINGKELKLYDLLKEYKAVILNFWYTTCSACIMEFPAIVSAYDSSYENADGEMVKYSDEVIIIAVNPTIAGGGDTAAAIKNFSQDMGLNFNVATDYDLVEGNGNITMEPALTTMFGVQYYPTTVVIDRYGLIAEIGSGSVTVVEKWTQTFDKYIADDYYPVYVPSTDEDEYGGYIGPEEGFVQEDSSVLENAVNGTNYDETPFTGTYAPEDNKDKDLSWPWVVDEFDGKQVIKPSNKGQDPSFSIVYTTVYLKKGEAFTFDYYSSTEEYDTLYVVVNNSIATQISGMSPYWEKSYAYIAIEDGEYEIGFCYIKDSSYSLGEDAVFITNVRIEDAQTIDKETYIFRECATGVINEFTMSYPNYVNVEYNENDGYYHVGDVNGPLLFADLLSGTQWNNASLYEVSLEGKCIGADEIDYNALVEEYAVYASNSQIGYCPVTKVLADGLKQIVKALGHELAANNPNQWLELCVYYSAYGTNGVELGLPTVGVCPFEPITFEGDGIEEPATASGLFDRIILPRGLIFGFTPTKSGVYKFYSTEELLETIGWICDENGEVIGETDFGLRIFAEQTTKGIAVDQNFVAYIYLEEGKTYLFRAGFYDVYEYSEITVEIKYEAASIELLTIASPGFFTSSDDEMSDIISGNYIDVALGDDGFYHVVNSPASDDFVYCDIMYINNITTGFTLYECLYGNYGAFDFGKDEFGNDIYDENGYYRVTGYDEDEKLVRFFVCQDEEGNLYYVKEVGEGEYTEENGYTYLKFDESQLENLANANCTEYVKQYVEQNLITDEESELYGCVKVDEQFAYVLGLLMDKYTFADVEFSWVKLCYYYKYVGPTAE